LNASTLLRSGFGRSRADGYAESDSRDVDEAALDDLAIAFKLLKLSSGQYDHIHGIALLDPGRNRAGRTIFNGCRVAG
jgi:hypothetical protein